MRFSTLLILVLMAITAIPTHAYNWKTYNDHRYTVVDAVNWADGESQSVALGGHLVTINDVAENEWILHNIIDPISSFAWIGLYQQLDSTEPNEGWSWISGETVNYTNWYAGEPNNLECGENWAEIYTSEFDGQWNDIKPETNWNPPLITIVEIPSIPEPSTIITILCGIGGLLMRRKIR